MDQDGTSDVTDQLPGIAGIGEGGTRARILVAARRIFAQRGYFDATVDDIIQICGVSRGTFYYYFRNKDDVFETLARVAVDELLKEAQLVVQDESAYERMRIGNNGYLRTWATYKDILRNLAQAAAVQPRFAALQSNLRQPFVDRIHRSLQRQVEEKKIRPMDPYIAANAIAGMFDWFASTWLSREAIDIPHSDIERVGKELTNLWYFAVFGEESARKAQ